MGYDMIMWNVIEENDAVCSVPFAVEKGPVKAPKLRVKGVGGSAFGTKTFDVNPDNFAKIRCYGKGKHKDAPYKGKDIHCVGIDMKGNGIATELLPKAQKNAWENKAQRSTELIELCSNVITGKIPIQPMTYDK